MATEADVASPCAHFFLSWFSILRASLRCPAVAYAKPRSTMKSLRRRSKSQALRGCPCRSFQTGRWRVFSYRSRSARKEFCALAALSDGAILLWRRFLARNHPCPAGVGRVRCGPMLQKATAAFESGGYRMLIRARKNLGAKSLAVSSRPKVYRPVSPARAGREEVVIRESDKSLCGRACWRVVGKSRN